MATAPPTITQLKERFISAQALHLASGLAPSAAFRAANEKSDQALNPRQLETVATVLDGLVQDHCRRVYAPQANRALAEQISDSYSKEADRKLLRDDVDGDGIGRDLDLANEEAIDSLPSTWISDRDMTDHPMEAKRYADAVEHLASLNDQRKEIKQRVERLRRLQATVDPLKTADGGVGIQENLVTRDGDVEKELTRMRMLLIRVAGRVGGLPGAGRAKKEEEDVEPLSALRKRDIDDFLADSKVFPGK